MEQILARESTRKLVTELLEIPSESRMEEIFAEVNLLSPDPQWSDYIYHSDQFYQDGNFCIDAFLDKIFAYKPIQL